MRYILICYTCILLVLVGCGSKSTNFENFPLEISLGSKAFVALELNQVSDTFSVQLRYWPRFSLNQLQTPQIHIKNDTVFILEITTHNPKQYLLNVKGINIPLFLTINDTIGVKTDLKTGQVEYDQSNVSINEFLLTNRSMYESHRNRMLELYHDYDIPYRVLYSKVDSIKNIEQNRVLNASHIPRWYRDLELQNIVFKIAHFKLSAPNYRNFINSEQPELPTASDLKFIDEIDLTAPYNQYLDEFTSFMNFYSFYLIYDKYFVVSDSVSQLFYNDNLAVKMFEAFDELSLPDQNFLVFATDQVVGDIRRNRNRKDERIKYLISRYGDSNQFVSYLKQLNDGHDEERLGPGDNAPSLVLEDLEGNIHATEDYQGNVVLLNFYTLGCVACYKEVPYQKLLIQNFDPENFVIINICVTESMETFKKAVQKYNLDGINVYTPGNWKNIVQREFETAGFPHYTVVDKRGLIIKNNTFRPSNPRLSKLIDSLFTSGS